MKKLLFIFGFILGLPSFAFADNFKGVDCDNKNHFSEGRLIIYKDSGHVKIKSCDSKWDGNTLKYAWADSLYIKTCNNERKAPDSLKYMGIWEDSKKTGVYAQSDITDYILLKLSQGQAEYNSGGGYTYPKPSEFCVACAKETHWDSNKSECVADDPFAGKSCSQFSGEERKQCCNSRWGNSVSRACCISDEADFKAKKNATVYGGICTCRDNTKEWNYTTNQCVAKKTTTSTNTNSNDNTQEIKTIDGINCDNAHKGNVILYKPEQNTSSWHPVMCEEGKWAYVAQLNVCSGDNAQKPDNFTDLGLEYGTAEPNNNHVFIRNNISKTGNIYLFTETEKNNNNETYLKVSDVCLGCLSGMKMDEVLRCVSSETTNTNTTTLTTTPPEEPAELKEAKTKLDSFFKYAEASRSGWKTADGKFNSTRLASDITAGVVLGTVGGVVSGVVIKKKQVEKGFEALHCTVGGQTIANWGDEFIIGLQK